MAILHIANTNFEPELSGEKTEHPVFLQLQYLPFLYAEEGDGVAVSYPPSPEFKMGEVKLHLLSSKEKLHYERIEAWGASPTIAKWAKEHDVPYEMPPWEVVREVNSKAFSFAHSPKLPHAALLKTKEEAIAWMHSFEGPKVLKTLFGLSGRGHLFLPSPNLDTFLDKNLPVIGEPWVERELDFSTQWIISPDKQIEFVGSTICINDERGQYRETRVGDISIPFLEEHKKVALDVLKKIAALGYFGNVGIDAMIFKHDQLHPIVEVNARKTMGSVALKIQRRHFPKQTISLNYSAGTSVQTLLPAGIFKNGSLVKFSRQFTINTLSR